jgi:hypothetical protein
MGTTAQLYPRSVPVQWKSFCKFANLDLLDNHSMTVLSRAGFQDTEELQDSAFLSRAPGIAERCSASISITRHFRKKPARDNLPIKMRGHSKSILTSVHALCCYWDSIEQCHSSGAIIVELHQAIIILLYQGFGAWTTRRYCGTSTSYTGYAWRKGYHSLEGFASLTTTTILDRYPVEQRGEMLCLCSMEDWFDLFSDHSLIGRGVLHSGDRGWRAAQIRKRAETREDLVIFGTEFPSEGFVL